MVASSFGNPACWVEGRSFLGCCAVSVFGPAGNSACWAGALLGGAPLGFRRCCRDPPAGPEELHRRAAAALADAGSDFGAAIREFAQLVHRVDNERHALGGARELRIDEVTLVSGLNEQARRWREVHLSELAARLPQVLRGLERAAGTAAARAARGGAPRVAVLTACTPDSAASDVCQVGAGLWQCYARRHGYHFIFDTTPFPSLPEKFRFGAAEGTEGLAALHADFGPGAVNFLEEEPLLFKAGSDGITFKWWQRWYAARRHLHAYDLLLVVDPDTSVFPSCFDVGLPEALGLRGSPDSWPGVIVRDPREGEDCNGGVVGLTRSPWGLLYLELLLAKSRWPVDVAGGSGWCQARQSAEYETLLEVIALSRAAAAGVAGGVVLDYTSECMWFALPQVVLSAMGRASMGCNWQSYLGCWRKNVDRLLGPPGARGHDPNVRLLDPEVVDINYRPWSNEPRYRASFMNATRPPPIANAAFLWHYVGIPRKADSMLRDFGLQSLEDTFDCDRLCERFGARGSQPPCKLGGSPRACPFQDSLLMPRQFGC